MSDYSIRVVVVVYASTLVVTVEILLETVTGEKDVYIFYFYQIGCFHLIVFSQYDSNLIAYFFKDFNELNE